MGIGVQNVGQFIHGQGGGIVDVKHLDHFGNNNVDSWSPAISPSEHNSLVGLPSVAALDAAAAAIGGAYAAWWSQRATSFRTDARTTFRAV